MAKELLQFPGPTEKDVRGTESLPTQKGDDLQALEERGFGRGFGRGGVGHGVGELMEPVPRPSRLAHARWCRCRHTT
ncbi:hypothetical protein [Streptomyces coeruleofuscus]|uniref:Uncharacterized protein n=1 Tax=Streptomyces coeruleofuscus TaxID=66879 RepID=A0ABN3JEM0_9ACTN